MEKAVFIDRDGTIARDVPYCHRVDDFDILPNVPEAVRLLNQSGFKIVVVTNQSGVAQGDVTEKALAQIHMKMKDDLDSHGAKLDAIYYCPHHPSEECDCRKPKTGLYVKAAKEHGIDVRLSYVIGDMQADVDAGRALGCKTVMVKTGSNGKCDDGNPPDYVAHNLLEAAKWIVKSGNGSGGNGNGNGTHKPMIQQSQPRQLAKETRQSVKTLLAPPATTILVPAYNEEKGLPIVLDKIFRIVDSSCEVIVIDDGSDDTTAEVASHYNCMVIKHKVNKGKGEALKIGIAHANAQNIIWIDADDTYPAETIPLLAHALEFYDMVVASRSYGKGNIPLFNRFGNWVFRTMIKTIYGFKPHDPCTGLFGARKCHLENMQLSSERFAIEPEIAMKGSRMGLRMLDVPIQYGDRVGETKLNGIAVGVEDLRAILGHVFWQHRNGHI